MVLRIFLLLSKFYGFIINSKVIQNENIFLKPLSKFLCDLANEYLELFGLRKFLNTGISQKLQKGVGICDFCNFIGEGIKLLMKILDVFIYLVAKLEKIGLPELVDLYIIENGLEFALYLHPLLLMPRQFQIILIPKLFIRFEKCDFGEQAAIFSKYADVHKDL
jgi:hypothetical protein